MNIIYFTFFTVILFLSRKRILGYSMLNLNLFILEEEEDDVSGISLQQIRHLWNKNQYLDKFTFNFIFRRGLLLQASRVSEINSHYDVYFFYKNGSKYLKSIFRALKFKSYIFFAPFFINHNLWFYACLIITKGIL